MRPVGGQTVMTAQTNHATLKINSIFLSYAGGMALWIAVSVFLFGLSLCYGKYLCLKKKETKLYTDIHGSPRSKSQWIFVIHIDIH